MNLLSIGVAKTDMKEVLSHRDRGTQVVSHVYQHVTEPKPDYAKMQELISGDNKKDQAIDDARPEHRRLPVP